MTYTKSLTGILEDVGVANGALGGSGVGGSGSEGGGGGGGSGELHRDGLEKD